MESDVRALERRRQEIADEIVRLQAEDAEIEAALRVFKRYAAPSSRKNGSASPKLGPPRPEGTPSLFNMTEAVLRAAIAQGMPGLTARGLVDQIGKRYWPGVKPGQILPLIYGFSKKGRIRKDQNGLFRPVNESTA